MSVDYHSYFAGCLSGFAQTSVGHPLDTIKVLSQNCQLSGQLSKEMKLLNFRRLYSGVSYPLLSSGFLNGISFGLANTAYNRGYSHFNSGLISGLGVGIVTAPIEYFKIQKQTHHLSFQQILRNISIRKMALGTTITRECSAYSIYFPTYYTIKEYTGSFTAGGLAGIASWTISYPFDTIKTRLQSGNFPNWLSSLKAGQIWKGYSICIARAALVNAVGWLVYEKYIS